MFEAAELTKTTVKRAVLVVTPPCRMLALFLAIALLGTDGAYGRSIIDLTGVNHDNTDLGGSELYAKAGAYYYGDDDPIDLTAAKVNNLDLTGLEITAESSIGLDPSRPSPSATPALHVPPSPSIDFGSHNTVESTIDKEDTIACEECDAGASCGMCLMLVLQDKCPTDIEAVRIRCLDVLKGEACEGSGECGTDDGADNCLTSDIYRHVECYGDYFLLDPQSNSHPSPPPPPPTPRTPPPPPPPPPPPQPSPSPGCYFELGAYFTELHAYFINAVHAERWKRGWNRKPGDEVFDQFTGSRWRQRVSYVQGAAQDVLAVLLTGPVSPRLPLHCWPLAVVSTP